MGWFSVPEVSAGEKALAWSESEWIVCNVPPKVFEPALFKYFLTKHSLIVD